MRCNVCGSTMNDNGECPQCSQSKELLKDLNGEVTNIMAESKKKRHPLLILMCTLIIVLIVSGVCIFVVTEDDRLRNNGDNSIVADNVKDSNMSKEEAEKILVKYTLDDSLVYDILFEHGLDDNVKLWIAINNTEKSLESFNCADQAMESGIVLKNIYTETEETYHCSSNNKVYSYEDVQAVYKRMFGKDLDPLEYVIVNKFDKAYLYKDNTYVELTGDSDCTVERSSYYFLENTSINEEYLLMNVKYLKLSSVDEQNCTVKDQEEVTNIQEIYDDSKDQLPLYTFKFKKNEEGYFLEEIRK